MPNPDVMIIIGAIAALIGGYFFVRYPRWRWRIALGGLLAAGLGVFLTWYILFRTDDATYAADRSAAEDQQAELDALFDEGGESPSLDDSPGAAETPAKTAPSEREVNREKKLTPTPPQALGTLPAGVGIRVGDVAPDATFLDLDGAAVTVGSLTAERPLLLVFYRGGWCPYCNNQVHAFSEGYARLTALGVDAAFASVDRPDAATKTRASWSVPFPLLGDPDATAHDAFHVVNALDSAGYERLEGFGIDIERWSGRDHHKIAIPAMFLIDRDRRVLWAHAARDYKVRPTLDALVPALRAALDRRAAKD